MKKPNLTEDVQEALDFIVRSQAESAARQSRIEEQLEAFAAREVAMSLHGATFVQLVDAVTESVGGLSSNLNRVSAEVDRLVETVRQLAQDVQALTGNLHALTGDVQRLTDDVRSMADDRRALPEELDTLARVAEGLIQVTRIHGRRLDRIEDGNV